MLRQAKNGTDYGLTDDEDDCRDPMNADIDPCGDSQQLWSLRGGCDGTRGIVVDARHIGHDQAWRKKDQAPLWQKEQGQFDVQMMSVCVDIRILWIW